MERFSKYLKKTIENTLFSIPELSESSLSLTVNIFIVTWHVYLRYPVIISCLWKMQILCNHRHGHFHVAEMGMQYIKFLLVKNIL